MTTTQGYAIARPMPGDTFPQWLEDYTPNQNWLISEKKHITDKEKKLNLFTLVSEHWKNMFIANIQASQGTTENWPIMNSKRCHCGKWLGRSKHEHLFEVQDIERSIRKHEAVHLIAHTIFAQFEDGDVDTARADLPKLQTAFDKMIHSFRMYN